MLLLFFQFQGHNKLQMLTTNTSSYFFFFWLLRIFAEFVVSQVDDVGWLVGWYREIIETFAKIFEFLV